jgi:type I restriction enzyme M protein
MIQDIDPARMHNGNTLTRDAFSTDKFDLILANPPYGVNWKAYAAPNKDEHAKLGHGGRFGAGLPRAAGCCRTRRSSPASTDSLPSSAARVPKTA